MKIIQIALGQHNDNFVCCPADALTWDSRKYLIIQEIIQNDPDIITLQVSVNHQKTKLESPINLKQFHRISIGSGSFQIFTIDAYYSKL